MTTSTQPTSTSPVPGVTEKQEDSDDLDLKGGLPLSLLLPLLFLGPFCFAQGLDELLQQ